MKSNCRNNILSEFTKIKEMPENIASSECILVLDNLTSKLLSRVISLDHIFEFGFKDLVRVDKKKKSEPNAISIYFISSDSIQYLFEDFSNAPLYFSINILICDEVNDDMMKKISQNSKVIERLASFGQLHIPCSYFSQQIAIVAISEFKKPQSSTLLTHIINKTSIKIVISYAKCLLNTLIASYGALSGIQVYYYDSPFTRKAADALKEFFTEYRIELKSQQQKKIKVVLMDRQIDMLSPLVYSFYYLPLLMDTLPMTFDDKAFKILHKKEEKDEQLDVDNKILKKYKSMHIYKAFETIHSDLQEFKQTSKAAQFQKGNKNQNIRQVMKELPDYNKAVKNYNEHIELMDQIGKLKSKEKLDDLCELHHTIVTGYNAKMQTEKDKKITQKVQPFLQQNSTTKQKIRLILLTLSCLDVGTEEKNQLIKRLTKYDEYGEIAMNINKIIGKAPRKYRMMKYENTKDYILDRHQPTSALVVDEILRGNIPSKFKTIQLGQIPKSIGSPLKKNKQQQQIGVCMVGGIGFNEVSSLDRLGRVHGGQINVISDCMVTSEMYLRQLTMI